MQIQTHTHTEEKPSIGTLLSAMCLVGGTCIGGGMLALPLITAPAGFFPSLLLMFVCYLAMTLSSLLLLEATLWMERGAHMITLAGTLLGRGGRLVAWVLYLFICYASLVAYTAGGGVQLADTLSEFSPFVLSKPAACILFFMLFGTSIYFGSRTVGRVNALFFIGMIGAYVALIVLGTRRVDVALLQHKNWSPLLLATPLLFTAFSFQTLLPSLAPYLKRHVFSLRLSVIGGTSLAFLVYAIWLFFILGVIPLEGPSGLLHALQEGEPATTFLDAHLGVGKLVFIAEYFAFFALVTSFLGTILGLFDFLADGLKISKEGFGKLILTLLIAVPTLFFAIYYERAFLVAMELSGGYGDSILNGLLPVCMVWVGRYRLGFCGPLRVFGGKGLLLALFAFFLAVVLLQVAIQLDLTQYVGIKMPS